MSRTARLAILAALLGLAVGVAWSMRQPREPAPNVYPCDTTWEPQDCPPNH